jgi:phosphinothricin acetyltransferase
VSKYTIIHCAFERHAEAILEIFNEVILNSTALYDYKPRAPQSMVGWFDAKRTGGFPVIGVEDDEGMLLGFGSYGTFRAWPAYKYTVEHSVYVHKDHRGRGLGRAVMRELIAAARQNDVYAMIGGIDATNTGSIVLHEQLGFKHAGTLPQVGFKFGRWLDLAFYQLLLDTPAHPVDDSLSGNRANPSPAPPILKAENDPPVSGNANAPEFPDPCEREGQRP